VGNTKARFDPVSPQVSNLLKVQMAEKIMENHSIDFGTPQPPWCASSPLDGWQISDIARHVRLPFEETWKRIASVFEETGIASVWGGPTRALPSYPLVAPWGRREDANPSGEENTKW
jgi:hypothetical protein